MKKNLIYELVEEYKSFKLWNVFINRPINGKMRKVFLYKTTTSKIKNKLNPIENLKKEEVKNE